MRSTEVNFTIADDDEHDDGDDGEGKHGYFCSCINDGDLSVVQVKYVALPKKKEVNDSTTSSINVAFRSKVET